MLKRRGRPARTACSDLLPCEVPPNFLAVAHGKQGYAAEQVSRTGTIISKPARSNHRDVGLPEQIFAKSPGPLGQAEVDRRVIRLGRKVELIRSRGQIDDQ